MAPQLVELLDQFAGYSHLQNCVLCHGSCLAGRCLNVNTSRYLWISSICIDKRYIATYINCISQALETHGETQMTDAVQIAIDAMTIIGLGIAIWWLVRQACIEIREWRS